MPNTTFTERLRLVFRAWVTIICSLFLSTHFVHADVCISKDPRDSCLGYGAAALLEHDGIIKFSRQAPYFSLSEQEGRPKAFLAYNIYGEFLRDPSDEEWRNIEAELINRVKQRICFEPQIEFHGVVEMNVSSRFIDAGGIVETRVYFRYRRDGRGLGRLLLLDFEVSSCGNIRFKNQLLPQVVRQRPFLLVDGNN